jgi:GTP-binding protein
LRDGRPEICFVGRSNVGKSSLLNRLLGRKGLARTGSHPGRTRSVNYFLINDRLYFVDLPGYGYAKAGRSDRAAWADLADRYFRDSVGRTVVLLIDSKVGATPLDVQARDYLESLGAQTIVVATKVDRLGRNQRMTNLRGIRQSLGLAEETKIHLVSAETGEGISELWGILDARLSGREKRAETVVSEGRNG